MLQPTGTPSALPSASPSQVPTKSPTHELTTRPSASPSRSPSDQPSNAPSLWPTTRKPTANPITEVSIAALQITQKGSPLTSSQLKIRRNSSCRPPVFPVLCLLPALRKFRRKHPPMSLRRDHLLHQRDHPRVSLPTLLRFCQPQSNQRPIPTLR